MDTVIVVAQKHLHYKFTFGIHKIKLQHDKLIS